MLKRFLGVILIAILTATVPLYALAAGDAAPTPTDVEAISARLAQAETLWPDGSAYIDSWDDGCTLCYGFVRELFRYVFDAALPRMWRTYDARFDTELNCVYEVAHADWYSLEKLQEILAMAQPGDVFIATTGGRNHGVIVRSAAEDGSGIYVYDANWGRDAAGRPLIRSNGWWSAEKIHRDRPGAVTLYRYLDVDETSVEAGVAAASAKAPVTNAVLTPQYHSAAEEAEDSGETEAETQMQRAASKVMRVEGSVVSERRVYGTKESIRFHWDAVTGATGYSVSLWRDEAMIYSAELGDSRSFVSTPLQEGSYFLAVQAHNAAAAPAGFPFLVTDSTPDKAAAPQTERSVYGSTEQIAVYWSDVPGAESYRLYVLHADGSAQFADFSGDVTAALLPALREGDYSLCIRSFNHAGYSDGAILQISVQSDTPAQKAAAAQTAASATAAAAQAATAASTTAAAAQAATAASTTAAAAQAATAASATAAAQAAMAASTTAAAAQAATATSTTAAAQAAAAEAVSPSTPAVNQGSTGLYVPRQVQES